MTIGYDPRSGSPTAAAPVRWVSAVVRRTMPLPSYSIVQSRSLPALQPWFRVSAWFQSHPYSVSGVFRCFQHVSGGFQGRRLITIIYQPCPFKTGFQHTKKLHTCPSTGSNPTSQRCTEARAGIVRPPRLYAIILYTIVTVYNVKPALNVSGTDGLCRVHGAGLLGGVRRPHLAPPLPALRCS